MDTLSIKNASQAKTWLHGIRMMNCTFSTNPWGKQYTYGNRMKQLSEVEQLRLQVELLKKVSGLVRKSTNGKSYQASRRV